MKINKDFDNVKMHGTAVKKKINICFIDMTQ